MIRISRLNIKNIFPAWLRLTFAAFALAVAFTLSGAPALADEKHSGVADESDMGAVREVEMYGMLPIYGKDVVDGVYEIEVDSSSNFFHADRCILTVKNEKMTAKMIMASHSYELLFLGTGKDAAAAPFSDYIKPGEDKDGNYTWEIPVEALDRGMDCASYSKNRHKWYDRRILFNAGSLPSEALRVEVPDYHRIEWALEELDKKQGTDTSGKSGQSANNDSKAGSDSSEVSEENPNEVEDPSAAGAGEGSGAEGEILTDPEGRAAFIVTDVVEDSRKDGEYSVEVNMTGGSGRATVSSPTFYIVKDGHAYARLIWSSSYYDYMIVGGRKYLNETKDGGNSTCTIPISRLDHTIPVIADTTAMGDPVEIEYNLTFYANTIGDRGLIPQEAAKKVLLIALAVILIGGVLNHIIKTRRKGR